MRDTAVRHLEKLCFLLNMDKLYNLSKVFVEKHGESNYRNGEYGDSVENGTFYEDFMVKLVWRLSGVFMEKTL